MQPKFAIEKFGDIYIELLENYELCNEESDIYHRELNINKNGYLKYEELGLFLMFTIRKAGKLIGQCGMYMTPSMINGEMIGNEDVLFIKKDHRGGYMALNFLKFIESELEKRGVKEIMTSSSIKNRAYLLVEKLGFTRTAYQYSKRIGVSK